MTLEEFKKWNEISKSQCDLCSNEIDSEWAYYTNDHICVNCYDKASEEEKRG
jgi:hypothetical protein